MFGRIPMATIGDVYEMPGEIKYEWRIVDFFRLSVETNKRYGSPKFHFSGASWEIRLYPNGEEKNGSDGWISLYLARMSTGFPITVEYTFSFKTAGGKAYTRTFTNVIDKKNIGWGISKFLLRSQLEGKKLELVPSDILTVICTLRNSELTDVVAGSFFSRLLEMSANFKEVYRKAKLADFLLKVDGRDIGVHRMVLESRSPVFTDMINSATKEYETGEASVNDIDRNTMDAILTHMYSGDIDNLTTENVLSLYAATVRYNIKDLKEICLKFILRNLSVEWVCDVIKFAEKHKEWEISRRARLFFTENADKILKSKNWETFSAENRNLNYQLVVSYIEGLFKKNK